MSEESLATRVNGEPNIYKGCSSSEMLMLAIISVVVWFPVAIIAGLLMVSIPAGAAVYVVGILTTGFLIPGIFRRLKSGKPDGHYKVQFRIFLRKHLVFRAFGLTNKDYILRSSQWDLGRTK